MKIEKVSHSPQRLKVELDNVSSINFTNDEGIVVRVSMTKDGSIRLISDKELVIVPQASNCIEVS